MTAPSSSQPLRDGSSTVAAADVEIFDPPMCCPTGLCGPTLDETLLDVDEMVLELQAAGLRVERYQMTSHPQAFLANPAVMALVRERQLDALPITVVRQQILKSGEYPLIAEVRHALNGERDE